MRELFIILGVIVLATLAGAVVFMLSRGSK